ncbi:hypothetical protein ACFVX3_20075 [Rhodococcus erythropolis]
MKDANDDALWVHRLIDAARRGAVLNLQAGAPATQYNPSTAHEWPLNAATTITTHAAEGPTDTTITGDDDCSTHLQYPCLNSFTYALTGVIPTAAGITRPDWAISSTAPVTVKLGLLALRILAWIFTAILLAGVTGLLRKSS